MPSTSVALYWAGQEMRQKVILLWIDQELSQESNERKYTKNSPSGLVITFTRGKIPMVF